MIIDERDTGNYSYEHNPILREVLKRECEYAISALNSILEMNEEINGTKCNMVIMNQNEFKKWKEGIIK